MQASIMGHSMGGHGALVIGLRNPDKYAAISAFAPIANPSEVRSIMNACLSQGWEQASVSCYLKLVLGWEHGGCCACHALCNLQVTPPALAALLLTTHVGRMCSHK